MSRPGRVLLLARPGAGTSPEPCGFWCTSTARAPEAGGAWWLGWGLERTARAAVDWMHGRAAESAEQLHPACGRAVRAWREDADECAEAVRRLRGGGEYRFALGDDGVLYVVAARPVYVPHAACPVRRDTARGPTRGGARKVFRSREQRSDGRVPSEGWGGHGAFSRPGPPDDGPYGLPPDVP